MFIKQFFDETSSTYTYMLADKAEKKALIIDPVIEHVDDYLQQLQEHKFELVAALDTHVHADHVTALGELRTRIGVPTYLGNPGEIDCADNPLAEGLSIQFGQHHVEVLYTPGHTDDSYCFVAREGRRTYLFSGDTLLIGGTGRTDFQNGNASELYDSIHQKLLTLPDETIVYPGHDYHGKTQSTIAAEKSNNVRINIRDKAAFIDFMNKLDLPDPKQMDVAVPANKSCGKTPFNPE